MTYDEIRTAARHNKTMSEPTTHEIVLRGRASAKLLRPLIDDFTLTYAADGNTHLVGDIRDPSHFHGILAHLTSVNAEVISLAPHQSASGQQIDG